MGVTFSSGLEMTSSILGGILGRCWFSERMELELRFDLDRGAFEEAGGEVDEALWPMTSDDQNWMLGDETSSETG